MGKFGVIPYLVVEKAQEALDFWTKVFGGTEVHDRMICPQTKKLMHGEIKIGETILFVCDNFTKEEFPGDQPRAQAPTILGGTNLTLYNMVENCDNAYQKALEAGCGSVAKPEDMFWGHRYAAVIDPYGYIWGIGQFIKQPTKEELESAMKQMSGEQK